MSRIDMSAVDYSVGQIEDLSQIFYEAVFDVPALNQFHTIVSGIKAKKQLIFMGEIGLSGRIATTCTPTPNTNSIPQREKFWDPAYIGDRFQDCFTDLLNTYFVWLGTGLKAGTDKPDLTNTSWSMFLEDRIGISIQEAVLRHAWFGDTAAELVADGGYIKAGTDIGYFTPIDGFWTQVVAITTAHASQRVTIAKNAGASYALQQFAAGDITGGTVTAYFNQLIFKADTRLRGAKDRVIICTQSLFDEYVQERQAVTNIEVAYNRVEDGIDTIRIQGIDVIPFSFMDRTITSYFDNGVKYANPHRAVFTTKSTLQIGVEEQSNLSDVQPFYDKKSKLYIVDYGFNLDALIAMDYMVMAAY